SAIRPETWEAVNRAVLASAKQDRLETGATVRIDSTVTAALMHEPSDSALLWDAVRVMTRLLRQASVVPGAPLILWRDRRRMAKKRARAIDYSRGQDKKRQLYRELIAATRATLAALQGAAEQLANVGGMAAERWRARLSHYLPLIEPILAQSERRVLEGLAVPASEKLVSLFEPHADIIRKGGRDVQYGHKLNLVTGKSGLILDVVVEAANPAEPERFMARRARAYRRLPNFGAGNEAGISCLKRAYGLARCAWRGLDHFKTYIWSAGGAHNLVLFARLNPRNPPPPP